MYIHTVETLFWRLQAT